MKKLQNNSLGQSILELAIFGSILLFVLGLLINYGLNLNYIQNLRMQTFRRALALAKERSASSRQVQLTVIKDLYLPNPSDKFGISESSPYTAGTSAVWSRYLYAEYEDSKPKIDLPKIDYIINGQHKTYTIADYGEHKCSFSRSPTGNLTVEFLKKKENDLKDKFDINGTLVSDNIYWYWKPIPCNLVQQGDQIDVDNDGKEEYVYKVEKSDEDNPDSSTVKFYYLDYQDGPNVEIDITKNEDLGEEIQGLQPEYIKEINIENTSLEKWEDRTNIKTRTKSKITEIISRIIKTKKGDEEVKSEIKKEEEIIWTTPH